MLALDQLLDNACQHANRSMPIQLSFAGSDGLDHCILEFASQSLDAPVASEDLERWSAPFVRGKPGQDGERVEGPGLGLALARELMRGVWRNAGAPPEALIGRNHHDCSVATESQNIERVWSSCGSCSNRSGLST